jgi:Delta3-Delta2-enoyl-CoA isomerase
MIEQAKQLLGVTQDDLTRPVILKQRGEVFYMLLNTKANTFTKDFVRAIHAALDQVEANDGPTALITLSLSKLFSGGIDLRVMSHL